MQCGDFYQVTVAWWWPRKAETCYNNEVKHVTLNGIWWILNVVISGILKQTVVLHCRRKQVYKSYIVLMQQDSEILRKWYLENLRGREIRKA
jgi:hypothetical protein